MLDVTFVACGTALVIGVLVDVLTTTLTLGEGVGPLTRRVLRVMWQWSLRLRPRGSQSRLLSNAGPALLVLTVVIWVVTTWAGWWLVFLGSGSIQDARTGSPASAGDVAYYAGFSVFTLGVGDFVADSPVWRVITSLASFGGLAIITLAITYLLSVVSAVVTRRALATQIRGLGASPTDMVTRGWSGSAFSPAFLQHLVGLTGPLSTVAQQHFAYPVLHYFRSRAPEESAPVAIAALDDALLLLDVAVATSVAPDSLAVQPVRRVIARYIRTAGGPSAFTGDEGPPPPPSVTPLVEAGIPLAPSTQLEVGLAVDVDRRRGLQRLVHEAGWSWPSP